MELFEVAQQFGINITPAGIAASLIFSVIGYIVYRFGRKNAHFPTTIIGIILMVYTMFTNDNAVLWGAGIALSFIAYQFMKAVS